MEFIPTEIPDVILIKPQVHGDQRGFFMETFHARLFAEAGIRLNFVQDNHSGSKQGTLRGLHYQIRQPQGKLLRVVAGEIFDVAVDLRLNAPTFGTWVGQRLSVENRYQLWVPPGFAHGFYVLSEWAELVYKITDFYAPDWERAIRWDDPDLAIEWPLVGGETPILSPRDAQSPVFREAEVYDS